MRAALRFYGLSDDGLRKTRWFESDWIGFFADRVAGSGETESRNPNDLASSRALQLLAPVRVHLEDPSRPLRLANTRIEELTATLKGSRIQTEEGQIPVPVMGDLEGQPQ